MSVSTEMILSSPLYANRYYDYIPTLERDLCSNFFCCGCTLADMHELVEHFESKHLAVGPSSQLLLGRRQHPFPEPPSQQPPSHLTYPPHSFAEHSSQQVPNHSAYPAYPPPHPFATLPDHSGYSRHPFAAPSSSPQPPHLLTGAYSPHVFTVPPSPQFSPHLACSPPPFYARCPDVVTDFDAISSVDTDYFSSDSGASESPVTPTIPLCLPPSSFSASPEPAQGGVCLGEDSPTQQHRQPVVVVDGEKPPRDDPVRRMVDGGARQATRKVASRVWPAQRRRSQNQSLPRKREKMYRCPRLGCTKSYLNPNGLKYHVEKGTCKIEGEPEHEA